MKTYRNALVQILGFPATLIHWDSMVLDRWLWLKRQFRTVHGNQRVLDVGCGGGAFSIGLARMGHHVLGLTSDRPSVENATQRAALCDALAATFREGDARQLDAETDLAARFDTIICLECIEHILDDEKLMRDMARCLRPGGRLLLTAPNEGYVPITRGDAGPFSTVEDGGHVRKGYGPERLHALCRTAGLATVSVSYCSGFLSQKITWILRTLAKVHPLFGWLAILPLRVLPPALDPLLTRLTRWPGFSICLVAEKPRDPGTP